MDVYYNDQLLPGKEIVKPTLKIGEPFNSKNQFNSVSKIRSICKNFSVMGRSTFEVIDGPGLRKMNYILNVRSGRTSIFTSGR